MAPGVTATTASTSSRSYGSARSSCCSSRRRARSAVPPTGPHARSPRPRSSSHRPPRTGASAYEALGHAARHAAFGDDAWAAYAAAVDALRDAGSPDHDRLGRLTGFALETIVRWSGTMKDLPEEEVAQGYLDYALERVDPADSEARVRLMTALAFWSHGFPTTTSPYREATLAEETGTAAAEMALRLGRPELAVVALDSVQHALQRQHRYEAATESARYRLELAKTAGDLSESAQLRRRSLERVLSRRVRGGARSIGLEGYDLLRADGPIYAVHSRTWAATPAFYLGDWDAVLHDLELIIEGLGVLAEDLTSGFAQCWPTAVFVDEARGNHEAADRLLDDVLTVESRRRTGLAD